LGEGEVQKRVAKRGKKTLIVAKGGNGGEKKRRGTGGPRAVKK